MTRDDLYQVTYKCSECGKQLTIDDTSLVRIAAEFVRLGWLNEAQPEVAGKVEYVVTCPACVAADDEYREWLAVQESQEMEMAATRW